MFIICKTLFTHQLISAIPGILSITLVWFLVESPLWFLTKDRKAEAEETLLLLRGPAYEFDQEIKELEDALDTEPTSIVEMLVTGTQPVVVMFFLAFFQVASGCEMLSNYGLLIFSDFEISSDTFFLIFQI